MNIKTMTVAVVVAAMAGCQAQKCACDAKPALAGCWAADIDGAAYWFGVDASGVKVLWGGSSPDPAEVVCRDDGATVLRSEYRDDGVLLLTHDLVLRPAGADAFSCVCIKQWTGKPKTVTKSGTARRIPALPPKPDLSKQVLGQPIDLLADGMKGWKAMNPGGKRKSYWSYKDGVLANTCPRDAKGKVISGDNLVSVRSDFKDFKLSYDVQVPKDCNSGVYLRGIYEIQTIDSYGKKPDSHNMAAFYGRLTPTVSAEKPAGEWQHVDVVLCDRHVTVTLNGTRIIDNQPVEGVTGGALTSDEFVAGPMYIQGDHSDAAYRNMILTPFVKDLR